MIRRLVLFAAWALVWASSWLLVLGVAQIAGGTIASLYRNAAFAIGAPT